MKFKGDRPFATPEAAEQKLLELANAIEADHAGRLSLQRRERVTGEWWLARGPRRAGNSRPRVVGQFEASWLGSLGRLGWVPVIRLPQSSACQRSSVEVRPTIPVCTLV